MGNDGVSLEWGLTNADGMPMMRDLPLIAFGRVHENTNIVWIVWENNHQLGDVVCKCGIPSIPHTSQNGKFIVQLMIGQKKIRDANRSNHSHIQVGLNQRNSQPPLVSKM